MDKERFLNTGLLEQYALGLTNEEETQQVEKYLEAFPELKNEVNGIQKAVEQYALEQAINPPQHIKKDILSEINDIESDQRRPSNGTRYSSSGWWLMAASVLGFDTSALVKLSLDGETLRNTFPNI